MHLPQDHTIESLKTLFKMETPRFDGNDALGWIFITHFFNFHNLPEEQRISISSFYMYGPALNWYQWMYNNHHLKSCSQFLHILQMGFVMFNLFKQRSITFIKLNSNLYKIMSWDCWIIFFSIVLFLVLEASSSCEVQAL